MYWILILRIPNRCRDVVNRPLALSIFALDCEKYSIWYIVGKLFENLLQPIHWNYFTTWPEVEIQDGGLQTGEL